MEEMQGYRICRETLFETGHGFALGYSPRLSDRYAVWQYTETKGGNDNYLGRYYKTAAAALKDFRQRVSDYRYLYKVRERTGRGNAIGYYRYYSTQRPVDINTYPQSSDNKPLVIINYNLDRRRPVAGGLLSAWGELVYEQPLTKKQAGDYELVPAPGEC